MANPNPYKARLAKKPPPPGNVDALLQELWASILEVRAAMLWAATLPEVCQGVHATAQAASVYMRLLEAAEYGPRLAALEKAVEEMQHAELHRGPLGQAHNGRH